MSDIKESVTLSLDGSDADLHPFFPYLLQDIWELGSSSKILIDLLRRNHVLENLKEFRILDLGCGKGAISIPVIKTMNGSLFGIDAMPEFIKVAEQKAFEFGVSNACKFMVSDIRNEIERLSGFNLILLSSIGPVIGNVKETLLKLNHCLVDNGYVFLDDGYISEEIDINLENVPGENEFFEQIGKSNYEIIDKYIFKQAEMEKSNKVIYSAIKVRADELKIKFPDKKLLFEKYLDDQKAENDLLENIITCASLLLRKK